MLGGPIKENEATILAEKIIQYANNKGMWPTIDFIVKRWCFMNPDYAKQMKQAILDDRSVLLDEFGSNELTKEGKMSLRRMLEVPNKIMTVLEILFKIEIQNYTGGEKKFWKDFGTRYPIFKVPDKL